MKSKATIQIEDDELDVQLIPKEFSTGSVGYHGQSKGTFNDKRYQVNVLVVEIGSKNKSRKKSGRKDVKEE